MTLSFHSVWGIDPVVENWCECVGLCKHSHSCVQLDRWASGNLPFEASVVAVKISKQYHKNCCIPQINPQFVVKPVISGLVSGTGREFCSTDEIVCSCRLQMSSPCGYVPTETQALVMSLSLSMYFQVAGSESVDVW